MTSRTAFAFILALFTLLSCSQGTCAQIHCDPDFEIRAAIFFPQSGLYRKIYENVPAVQTEASYQIWNDLRAWGNVTFLWKEGHSVPLENQTDLSMVPFSIGLKYVFHCRYDLDLCLGGGAAFIWTHIHDHSPYVIPKTNKFDCGGVLKMQLIKRFGCFYGSIFTDYILANIHIHRSHRCVTRHSEDIGGLFLGLSIGKEF